MDDITEYYHHMMCYHFHERFNATETAHKICEIYGPDDLRECVVRKWFSRFQVINCSVKDVKQSGRLRTVDTDKITTLVDANPHLTVREIQEILGILHESCGAPQRRQLCEQNECVTHELSNKNLPQRLNACNLLLKKNKEHSFLKKMITGNEQDRLQ